jgi:hypothetical protein
MTKWQKGLTGEALRGSACAKRLVQDRLGEESLAEVFGECQGENFKVKK